MLLCCCSRLNSADTQRESANIKNHYLTVLNKHNVFSKYVIIFIAQYRNACVWRNQNSKSKLKYSPHNSESPLQTTITSIAEQDFSVCTWEWEWNLSGPSHHACLELKPKQNKILKTCTLYPEDIGLLQNSFRSSKSISLFHGLIVYIETSR